MRTLVIQHADKQCRVEHVVYRVISNYNVLVSSSAHSGDLVKHTSQSYSYKLDNTNML